MELCYFILELLQVITLYNGLVHITSCVQIACLVSAILYNGFGPSNSCVQIACLYTAILYNEL